MSDNQVNKAEQVPPVDAVGLRLRRARQARKLEIDEIARQLRLKEEIIIALEDDDLGNLPAPIYTRGYIRSYAVKVGIASDELIEAYDKMIVEQSVQDLPLLQSVKQRKPGDNRIVGITLIIAVVLLSLFIASWLDHSEQDMLADVETVKDEVSVQESSANENVAIINPDLVDARKETGRVIESGSNADEVETTSQTLQEPQIMDMQSDVIADADTDTSEIKKTADEKSQVVVTEIITNGDDKLELLFTDNCWTEVHDNDGKRLLFLMARKGRKYTLTGKAPFLVLLGNSPGVNVSINGDAFDQSAYNRGKVARFYVGL